MRGRTWRVIVVLFLGFAACMTANAAQPEPAIVETSPPITVVRAMGSLTIIADFGGTLLLDDVEIATVFTDEEVVLRNVRTGQRLVEIRSAHESVALLVSVEKDRATTIRFNGAIPDASSYTIGEEETMPRSVLSCGGGVYFYDMEEPVLVAEIAYSYYTDNDFAIGGVVGLERGSWVEKAAIQATFGDTRVSATGLRFGFFADDVLLVGVCVYSPRFWLSLDYSFPDPGYAGEIHISLGYSFRL